MTGCSRACRVRRYGIPPPPAVRSAAASRTRTRGSRAAARPVAPRRPRRSAIARRRSRRSPHELRRLRVLPPTVPPHPGGCGLRSCSSRPPLGLLPNDGAFTSSCHHPSLASPVWASVSPAWPCSSWQCSPCVFTTPVDPRSDYRQFRNLLARAGVRTPLNHTGRDGTAARSQPSGAVAAVALADDFDVLRLGPLLALRDVELDLLPFLEAAVAATCDRAEVHEHIWATFDFDETVALVAVEPLHRALRHLDLPRSGSAPATGTGPNASHNCPGQLLT